MSREFLNEFKRGWNRLENSMRFLDESILVHFRDALKMLDHLDRDLHVRRSVGQSGHERMSLLQRFNDNGYLVSVRLVA